MESQIQKLQNSLYTAFIDKKFHSKSNIKPKLIVNNQVNRENLLNYLLEEMDSCHSFAFSVAFITESGLAMLKSKLYDLKLKGVSGKILTSTFLYFNKPKIFQELMKLENVEIRIAKQEGFHSKGYAFQHDSNFSLVIGSSNLTGNALKTNYELNLIVSSLENGEIIEQFNQQFDSVWNESTILSAEWINSYRIIYEEQTTHTDGMIMESAFEYRVNPISNALTVKPNKMQRAALLNLETIRNQGAKLGLIISATGTGKTYLAAFDVRSVNPKRVLFIVHREQILQKAMLDFKKIFGGVDRDFGIYSGSSRSVDAKYLFATIQTISKHENINQFKRDEFDYILIDEVHKAGADSYLRTLEYFKPEFCLGMTATPDRTDGFNIYQLFDYNIAYEIRLQEALEEDMLCPFHYYGVSDIEIDGNLVDETTLLSQVQYEERTKYLLDKINYYSFSGNKVRGLIFCSRKDEAAEMAKHLSFHGIRAKALTGEHSQEERLRAVVELENGFLDYIVSVDIFNEGIDIPSINQVVMMRQTQSSIIFIQQLGRGLRKHDSKEFVTIIDFIGNYKNNYLIPIALTGDQSQNKDTIRRSVKDTSFISGISSVNFEEVAKTQIFKAITNTKLDNIKALREAFVNLKNKINRVPFPLDFIRHNSIDPEVICSKWSYQKFLVQMGEEVQFVSEYEDGIIQFVSNELMNGKRLHEVILFRLLLEKGWISKFDFQNELCNYEVSLNVESVASCLRVCTLEFFGQIARKKYGDEPLIIEYPDKYVLNAKMENIRSKNGFVLSLLKDLIETSMIKCKIYNHQLPLTLYQKYTRKDVCRLLNWENDESSTIYGYKPKHGTCPIFITYHKNEEVEASIQYGDEFLSPDVLRWFTRSKRTLKSDEVLKIIHAKESGLELHIFVKKDDDEGTDFYYLGTADLEQGSEHERTMLDKQGKEIPVVVMNLILKNAIEHKLYRYLINE